MDKLDVTFQNFIYSPEIMVYYFNLREGMVYVFRLFKLLKKIIKQKIHFLSLYMISKGLMVSYNITKTNNYIYVYKCIFEVFKSKSLISLKSF